MYLAVYTLWLRDIVRFYRQRSRIVGALATPVVFWILLGSGLGASFRVGPDGVALPGGYLEYFYPGTLALIVLFTAIFSTISVIEDRQEGFLQGVLVAPVPRTAIVLGKVLGGTTLAVLQAALFLALAPVAHVRLTWLELPLLGGVLALIGLGLTGLGFLLAWWLNSTQGFHAVMNLVLLPMWLLSGAVFPAEGAAGWIRAIMAVNPMTYAVSALRSIMWAGGTERMMGPGSAATLVPFGKSILIVALFGATVLVAGTILVSRRTYD